jgi:dTDP-4-dehydrorhamnose reductase
MKVLITGARGQVGRALVNSAPPYVNVKPYGHMQLNITDPRAVADCVRFHKPDVIVNAAAYTQVDRAESVFEHASSINRDGPKYLAIAARDNGARLVHLSTDFVFDGATSIPYAPTAPTNPINVYGVTKRDGENAILEVLPDHSTILRTAWLYAAEGRNFVRTMLQVMKSNTPVSVVADQIGTPTAAQSVAEVIWAIVSMPETNGIHHWTDAGVASWYDFAVAIAEEGVTVGLLRQEPTIVPIRTSEYPTPARRPPYSVLDKTSLTSLGLAPQHWRARLRNVLLEIKNA